jgi:hypothetical protein
MKKLLVLCAIILSGCVMFKPTLRTGTVYIDRNNVWQNNCPSRSSWGCVGFKSISMVVVNGKYMDAKVTVKCFRSFDELFGERTFVVDSRDYRHITVWGTAPVMTEDVIRCRITDVK